MRRHDHSQVLKLTMNQIVRRSARLGASRAQLRKLLYHQFIAVTTKLAHICTHKVQVFVTPRRKVHDLRLDPTSGWIHLRDSPHQVTFTVHMYVWIVNRHHHVR